MKSLKATAFLLIAASVPFMASAQTQSGGSCGNLAEGGFKGVVDCIIEFLDYGAIVILALAVFYTLWGAFLMATDEEKRQKGKDIVLYGIIGIFLMTSIWGLVSILNSTFRLDKDPLKPPELKRVDLNLANPFGK